MNTNNEQPFKDNVNVNANNTFIKLYEMMNEYNSLNKEQKRKYMSMLAGWYMKEKDTLNLINSK